MSYACVRLLHGNGGSKAKRKDSQIASNLLVNLVDPQPLFVVISEIFA